MAQAVRKAKPMAWAPNDDDWRLMDFIAAKHGDGRAMVLRRALRTQAKADGCRDKALLALAPETRGRPPQSENNVKLLSKAGKGDATNLKRKAK